MSRLRELLRKVPNRIFVDLKENTMNNLKPMLSFLQNNYSGIDMNLFVLRKLTKIYRSDSTPVGLVMYSSNVFLWRYYTPE